MTSLLEGARTTGHPGHRHRRSASRAWTPPPTAARGRLDDALVDDAAAVVERAAGRLRLSADHTVVAIAGATGSGKSSTFNALTGLDLAAVGVRRPTTSWATACVWGTDGADELLDWLGIPERHRTVRDSMLDARPRRTSELEGVVLLDLPDHDSTEVSHHLEVDRLVELADLLVWVLDPQKYADAAIHDRYLAPLAGHREVMLVVLNHIDTVPGVASRRRCSPTYAGCSTPTGSADVPVLGVSARHGTGIAELRERDRPAGGGEEGDPDPARRRPRAPPPNGSTRRPAATRVDRLPQERVAALDDAFAEAAGVPTVVHAVEESTRLRANRATGWPVTAWLSRLKPDPLKRLHLDLGREGKQLTGAARTSVPEADPGAAGPGRHRGAGARRRRLGRHDPAVGRPPYAGRRPRGSTSSTTGSTRPSAPPTSAPPGSRSWAGAVRRAAVAADPVRARRRRVAGRAGGDGLPPAAGARTPPRGWASRCRR